MDGNVIYSVAWWNGVSPKITTFTKRKNANTFAERLEKNGDLITIGVYTANAKEYLKLSKNCVDYEPPKKG